MLPVHPGILADENFYLGDLLDEPPDDLAGEDDRLGEEGLALGVDLEGDEGLALGAGLDGAEGLAEGDDLLGEEGLASWVLPGAGLGDVDSDLLRVLRGEADSLLLSLRLLLLKKSLFLMASDFLRPRLSDLSGLFSLLPDGVGDFAEGMASLRSGPVRVPGYGFRPSSAAGSCPG